MIAGYMMFPQLKRLCISPDATSCDSTSREKYGTPHKEILPESLPKTA